MYVDESGDPGLVTPDVPPARGPSHHYILSGAIVPSEEWRNYLTVMVELRRALKAR
jgi:hypothetical protein